MRSILGEVKGVPELTKFKQGVLYINSGANSNVVVMATATDDELEGVCVYSDGCFPLGDIGWNSDVFTEFHGKIILEN